jgi:uncharacterized repeat protein (TIGR01451 family)
MLKSLKLLAYACLTAGASIIGFEGVAQAQNCPITFSSGSNGATVIINGGPWVPPTGDFLQADNPAYFNDQVTIGNAMVPAGYYLGWCVDFSDMISPISPTGGYSTLMFSSCDPNLDTELHNLGLGYPGTVYVPTNAWNEVNYLLNHQNGAYFNNVQIAIWELVGGPVVYSDITGGGNPPYDTNIVAELETAALANSSYVPGCGDVIAVVLAVTDDSNTNAPVQLTILQVPITCPKLTIGTISSCYSSVEAAEAAAVAATTYTGGCGGMTYTASVTGTCQATITVIGTDACGNTGTATRMATILTNPPTFGNLPPKTAGYECYSAVPPPPMVTATDACGTPLTVNTNFSETHAGSSCGDIITRIWTTVDCAGQPNSFTETITVQNTNPPAMTKGSISNCYTTLAAADAAALAATSGKAYCSDETVKLTVSDNGQFCPATITVTATDNCGLTSKETYMATIITAKPALHNVPANTTVLCVSEIPVASKVTATDSCGTALTVTTNQTESNPTSTCSNVITRTWSATDCVGQTVTGMQVITQYNNVAMTLICPTNVTVVTNVCQMYCTFTAGDWGGSCNGGSSYNNNWWQSYCGQNSASQCFPSFTNWWNACGANSSQCATWWNNWNNNNNPPTNWWGCWSGNQGSQYGNQGSQYGNQWSQFGNWQGNQNGNWFNSWNNNNNGSQSFVPCAGNNPDSILSSCFNKVYPSGCVTVGLPGSGNCVTFTSCSAAQTCLNWAGSPGVLSKCATNPSSCSASSFCAQVLALRLNCDFGDYGCAPGFVGKCGDLVLCNASSPCNGQKVRDILSTCNRVLGGGSCPQGCTVQSLCSLCSNLNQCFEGCQVSSWCSANLCSVYIPLPAQTGTPTFSGGCSTPTLTYCDTVSTGSCPATYVINREWIAIDGCGNSNSCLQLITVAQTNSSSLSGLVVLACSGDANLSNNEGLANVTVTLENSQGGEIATTTTGANGSYSFGSLAPGSYIVVVTPPSGYTENYPASSGNDSAVTLAVCQSESSVNFAYTGSTPAVTLIKTGPSCAQSGGTITYCFAVTNTGNTCETLSVVDPLLGGTIFSQSSVAPGQGFLFTSNYVVGTNICTVTNTASAIGTAPNGKSATNTSSVTTIITTKCVTSQICGSFNSQNPGNGYVWCNAHLSCTPGKACTVYCQNATVTLSCKDGKSYTFPVPDCQVNFSPNCSSGSSSFNGTSWATTLPCAGDSQVFLSGCGIPWQSDFANCQSVCWTGTFSCSASGVNCNWQWGAACYNNNNLGNCGNVNVKACQQTSCGYNNNDYAGTPENCKSNCQGGACGTGGNNYCGSFSSTGSFTCK